MPVGQDRRPVGKALTRPSGVFKSRHGRPYVRWGHGSAPVCLRGQSCISPMLSNRNPPDYSRVELRSSGNADRPLLGQSRHLLALVAKTAVVRSAVAELSASQGLLPTGVDAGADPLLPLAFANAQ